MLSQSRRDHHSVMRKQTPTTMDAILDATTLKPQKIRRAPTSEDPRYPAGRVIQPTPPAIIVTPPSRGSSSMDLTRAPVQQPVAAWPNS